LYYGNVHCNTRSDAVQSAQKDYRNQLGFLSEQRVHGGVVNHITAPTMNTRQTALDACEVDISSEQCAKPRHRWRDAQEKAQPIRVGLY